MDRFSGTLLTKLRPQIDKEEAPERALTRMSEETDKALLDLLKKVNETSASAADAASVNSSLTAIDASMIAAIKGMKYGLDVSYVSADVLTISPGAVEVNGEIISIDAPLAITSSMVNFPAAGAWAFVTMEKGGTHRLFPATGAGNVRPSDACFQLTGGGVGFDDTGKQGYYLDPERRIIDAIHRANATTWYLIKLGAGIIESGQDSLGDYQVTFDLKLNQQGLVVIPAGAWAGGPWAVGPYYKPATINYPRAYASSSLIDGVAYSISELPASTFSWPGYYASPASNSLTAYVFNSTNPGALQVVVSWRLRGRLK